MSSQGVRVSASAVDKEAPRTVGAGLSAPRAAVRPPVTASGFLVASEGHRRRRIALKRNVYRCRVAALLVCVVMVGAFAADRPVAGVLASALAFIVLRCAAEARAEL